ncbi:MAG: hypothetical protein AB7T06_11015 [Kofleriaceae bacterium]
MTRDVQETHVMETVMTAAEGHEVFVGVVAAVLAVDDVVQVEVVTRSATRHAALVHVSREETPALLRRERVLRTRGGIVDVTHDRRVASECRELGIVELGAVAERVTVGGDPDLRRRRRVAVARAWRRRGTIADRVQAIVVVDELLTTLGFERAEQRVQTRSGRWLHVKADEAPVLVRSGWIRGPVAAHVPGDRALDFAVGHAARVTDPLFFGLGDHDAGQLFDMRELEGTCLELRLQERQLGERVGNPQALERRAWLDAAVHLEILDDRHATVVNPVLA